MEMRNGRREDEISLYTVAIPEINPFAVGEAKVAQDAAIDFIRNLDGFVAVHPVFGQGTLLLFRTKDQAKKARIELKNHGCPAGKNVTECFVKKTDVERAMKARGM